MPDGDSIAGSLGENVSRSAVGKDIQQVSINLSDKTPSEIAEIVRQLAQKSERFQIALVGDSELGVPGVVFRLNDIDRKLEEVTQKVTILQQKLNELANEVDDLRDRVRDYGGSSHTNQRLLYFIAILVVLSVGIATWQAF